MRSFVPLYDMRWLPEDANPDRFLSVMGFEGDRRHTLGIPPYVSDLLAVQTARARGWKVAGLWRRVTGVATGR